MIDLRPMIHIFAMDAAQQALRERKLDDSAEATKAWLAAHPELLIEAELTLRRAPGVRQLAKQWRANAEAELRENRAAKRADANRRLER